ncbi:uncharacterized protein [Asterias amurensis]
MQAPLEEQDQSVQYRSLASLAESYKAYQEDGCRKVRAKDVSNSVIAKAMIPVEIDQVVIPSLHISLGIYKKLFDMFESSCHNIDLKLYKWSVEFADEDDDNSATNFEQQISNEFERQQKIDSVMTQKQKELEQLEEELPLQFFQDQKNAGKAFEGIANKAFKIRCELEEMEHTQNVADLPFGTGPIASGLDDTLKRHRVERQAYHGKAFVGNHVQKCCRIEVIKDLTATPKNVMKDMICDTIPVVRYTDLIREASSIGETFMEIFMKFADVHFAINHAKAVSTEDLNQIDACITDFMSSYRRMFPGHSITPKMHLLERHAVEQLRRFGVGFGLMNEQGGELVHTEFNRTGRVVHGMKDNLQRLLTIMRRHHVSTTPEIQAQVITAVKRPKEE